MDIHNKKHCAIYKAVAAIFLSGYKAHEWEAEELEAALINETHPRAHELEAWYPMTQTQGYEEDGMEWIETKITDATNEVIEVIEDYVELPQLRSTQFVCVTDLVPASWAEWFYADIAEGAPFSWGDNNRSMVTASTFMAHAKKVIELSYDADENRYQTEEVEKFMKKLELLGETYIDLEN